jgi:hypothetical protein
VNFVEEAISIESFVIRGFVALESGHIHLYEVLESGVRESKVILLCVSLCQDMNSFL